MKKLKWIATGIVIFLTSTLIAQVSVNISIGSPPAWGPAGYSQVRYYYLPDVEAYYDVRSGMFIYFGGQSWVHRSYLPARYKGYDLYRGYKVVMPEYHGNTPYTHFKEHKTKYKKGSYHGRPQQNVGHHPEKRNSGGRETYNNNHGKQNNNHEKNNSQHNDKKGMNNHGNGHDKGKK